MESCNAALGHHRTVKLHHYRFRWPLDEWSSRTYDSEDSREFLKTSFVEPEGSLRGFSGHHSSKTSHVRTNIQKHRRHPLERSRLHHRARLHRADFVVAVPEIPRRS